MHGVAIHGLVTAMTRDPTGPYSVGRAQERFGQGSYRTAHREVEKAATETRQPKANDKT